MWWFRLHCKRFCLGHKRSGAYPFQIIRHTRMSSIRWELRPAGDIYLACHCSRKNRQYWLFNLRTQRILLLFHIRQLRYNHAITQTFNCSERDRIHNSTKSNNFTSNTIIEIYKKKRKNFEDKFTTLNFNSRMKNEIKHFAAFCSSFHFVFCVALFVEYSTLEFLSLFQGAWWRTFLFSSSFCRHINHHLSIDTEQISFLG